MDMFITMTTLLMMFTKNVGAFTRMGSISIGKRTSQSEIRRGLSPYIRILDCTTTTTSITRTARRVSTLPLRNLSNFGSSTSRYLAIDNLPHCRNLQRFRDASCRTKVSPSHSQVLYSTSKSDNDGTSSSDGKKDVVDPKLSIQRHSHSLELEISTIEDMEDVGAVLSVGAMGGDIFTLDGDLGAGKTCFSRGFVRASTGVSDLRVTSPTYLLSNTYPAGDDLT